MNLGTASVIRANSRTLPLADNTVDLVVTSPPYFALRSYQDGGAHYAGQIGDEPTPAEFVASLLEVTRECVRVLKPSGSLWVNLGDKYAGTGGGGEGSSDGTTGRGPRPPRGDVGIRAKSLVGIPWRYALACIDDLGLILRAEVIWSKPNGLPESVTDRVRRSHETWFHFTLEPRYFSAVDEIREAHLRTWEPHKNGGHAHRLAQRGVNAESNLDASSPNPLGKLPGSVWTVPTEPLRVPDHLGIDHFAAFPTEWPRRIIAGWSPAGVCVECGEGRRPVSMGESYATQGPNLAMKKNADRNDAGGSDGRLATVRTITGYACACVCECPPCPGRGNDGHGLTHCAECCFGTGVEADPTCPTHGTPAPTTSPAVVLDPFGGTGTTAMVAKALGRHGITVDMSADYCRLAAWRTSDRNQLAKVLGVAKAEAPDAEQMDLFGEATA